jgi:hypothetical protein
MRYLIVARHEGAAIAIGTYGVATTTTPIVVPAAVADELAGREDLEVLAESEDAEPAPADGE